MPYLVLWIQKYQEQKPKVKITINRHLKIFLYLTVINFFLRIVMYVITGVVMKGKAPSYMTITDE